LLLLLILHSFLLPHPCSFVTYPLAFLTTPISLSIVSSQLDKYQEQGELLDPHLEDMITPLMDIAREATRGTCEADLSERAFFIVYVLCKVRGYKTVVKFFPHEVSDLEPCLKLLAAQDTEDHNGWMVRYVLLLWLSIIVLIPFDLRTVDSGEQGEQGIISKLIEVGKSYLSDTGASRDASAVMLSKLFSRPDMVASHVADFFTWANSVLKGEAAELSSTTAVFRVTGVLSALAKIFKSTQRDFLLDKVDLIYDTLVASSEWMNNKSGLTRKLYIKLIQRIGLTYLKPQLAPWRYQRGHRSLVATLQGTAAAGTAESAGSNGTGVDGADDDAEVPEEIDDIINHLLDGIRDTNTVVRWSAAKGIGRITMRLPVDFADDVVASTLDMFSSSEGDGAWHGGCLALAELSRRGLLLPNRLDEVVPLVKESLVYDVRKGAHSIGSHVRDAACYVCWAFARAYAPELMEKYVPMLAPQLLAVACYDREVNCRRAASAAYQENVGRQGNFPHGIEINTTADYFALGNRQNAYLQISGFISKFPEYGRHMIDHLVDFKTKHWDISIRDLTARALAYQVHCDPKYMHDAVIPTLVPLTLTRDLSQRHGAIIAIAEVTRQLAEEKYDISDSIQRSVIGIVAAVEKKRMLNGRGGAVMRQAILRLIECIALAGLRLEGDVNKSKHPITDIQTSVDANLGHPDEDIQNLAASAVEKFTREYYTAEKGTEKLFDRPLSKYIRVIEKEDPTPYNRRGVSLALGLLPQNLLLPSLVNIVRGLVEATVIPEKKDLRDAETRRNAAQALGRILITVGEASRSVQVGAKPKFKRSVYVSLCVYLFVSNSVCLCLF